MCLCAACLPVLLDRLLYCVTFYNPPPGRKPPLLSTTVAGVCSAVCSRESSCSRAWPARQVWAPPGPSHAPGRPRPCSALLLPGIDGIYLVVADCCVRSSVQCQCGGAAPGAAGRGVLPAGGAGPGQGGAGLPELGRAPPPQSRALAPRHAPAGRARGGAAGGAAAGPAPPRPSHQPRHCRARHPTQGRPALSVVSISSVCRMWCGWWDY